MSEIGIPALAQIFACGFIGSYLVEVVTILRHYETHSKLTARYSQKGFWFTRFILALGGGFFALIYNPASLLLATHIGASTPLLVATLTKPLPDSGQMLKLVYA